MSFLSFIICLFSHGSTEYNSLYFNSYIDITPQLEKDLEFLGNIYPDITSEFVVIKGKFGPELIKTLSGKWGIPINFMFIGSPGNHFMYAISELGGVRLII